MTDNFADAFAKALAERDAEFHGDPFGGPGEPEDFDAVVAKLRAHAEAERRGKRHALGFGETP